MHTPQIPLLSKTRYSLAAISTTAVLDNLIQDSAGRIPAEIAEILAAWHLLIAVTGLEPDCRLNDRLKELRGIRMNRAGLPAREAEESRNQGSSQFQLCWRQTSRSQQPVEGIGVDFRWHFGSCFLSPVFQHFVQLLTGCQLLTFSVESCNQCDAASTVGDNARKLSQFTQSFIEEIEDCWRPESERQQTLF